MIFYLNKMKVMNPLVKYIQNYLNSGEQLSIVE